MNGPLDPDRCVPRCRTCALVDLGALRIGLGPVLAVGVGVVALEEEVRVEDPRRSLVGVPLVVLIPELMDRPIAEELDVVDLVLVVRWVLVPVPVVLADPVMVVPWSPLNYYLLTIRTVVTMVMVITVTTIPALTVLVQEV